MSPYGSCGLSFNTAHAMRRLPNKVARIEMEIEHARVMARLPVDATLLQPLNDDPGARFLEIAPSPPASIQSGDNLMSSEAYCSYIDDSTRAWSVNTREASETSRELTIAVIGQATPVLSSRERIAVTCRTFFDSFLPTRPSPSEAVAPARQRSEHGWVAASRSSARRTPTRLCRTGAAF